MTASGVTEGLGKMDAESFLGIVWQPAMRLETINVETIKRRGIRSFQQILMGNFSRLR